MKTVYLVSIPDCILNNPQLTIKTNVISSVVLPNNIITEYDNPTYYMPANSNAAGLYILGQINIPDEGTYQLLFRSMVVIRDHDGCDQPFLPLQDTYPVGFDFWSYSIHGCCFDTPCCPCDQYITDEWAQHRLANRQQRYRQPEQPGATSGQNIRGGFSCWCCVD